MSHDPFSRRMTRRHAIVGLSTLLIVSAAHAAPRHIQWSELTPKGWDPAELMREKFKGDNLDILQDDDPRVQKMMEAMREVWDNAPINPAMKGVTGRIPGYVVPLEEGKQGLKEFLLVPYYGACIHSPPPPANQIVHVVLSKPIRHFRTMDTVWVHGTLQATQAKSYMGVSGYRIEATKVEPYTRTPAQQAP